MDKALEFTHDLWVKAQLEAPPFAQSAVIPRLHEAKEIVRLLAKPYLPIYQLQGQGHSGPLTVTYVGLEFTKPSLTNLLFVENPVERKIGRIPFWRCDELANFSSSDIIIVEATKHLIRALPRQNAFVLPELVEHILDVRGDWQDVRSRFRRSVRRHDLRLIRKYGCEYDVSHDGQDFEEFYHQMYLPTMDDRHGELSSPIPFSEADQYFKHGWLFRVNRDGDWVSGLVCHPQQNVLVARILGVRNADAKLMHNGAASVLYYVAIQWANQHGFKAVNFLGSAARLRSGLFQHKRKWGTTVSVPPNLHRQIWIRVQRITPAVSQFLKENPFVVVDESGKLYGFVVVDDLHDVSAETRKEWEKLYVTSGLSYLLIRSLGNFAGESASVNGHDWVIPIPSSGSGQ